MALIILYIILLFVLLFILYPLWLKKLSIKKRFTYKEEKHPIKVTLIYLSHNGYTYIKQKLDYLLNELKHFDQYEIIIIDDCSSDDTITFLEGLHHEHLKVFYKEKQKGIPHSMNLAIENAQFEYVIFCDQRQTLTKGIVQNIIRPLSDPEVGAVSSKLSHIDKNKRISPLRIFENYLKKQESILGKLIGVYGPLYAIKKEHYTPIPENIILDDLFITLKILQTKKVIILEDAYIIDEDAAMLYNYKRIKRYLLGLIQLFFQKEIIDPLSKREKWMLFWHKYFKLIVPIILFFCNVTLGVLGFYNNTYLILFIGINIVGIFSIVLNSLITKFHYQSLVCINIHYILALFDIIIHYKSYKKRYFNNKK